MCFQSLTTFLVIGQLRLTVHAKDKELDQGLKRLGVFVLMPLIQRSSFIKLLQYFNNCTMARALLLVSVENSPL